MIVIVYWFFWFCLSFCGDVFDRFVLRLFDMRNALLLLKQLLLLFFCGCLVLFYWFVCEFCIETIIYVFFMCWLVCVSGLSCCCIEHPKGEYAVCLCFFFVVLF